MPNSLSSFSFEMCLVFKKTVNAFEFTTVLKGIVWNLVHQDVGLMYTVQARFILLLGAAPEN